MENLKVYLDEGAYMPVRAHEADAGMDLLAPKTVPGVDGKMRPLAFSVTPERPAIINTGVHISIPKGYVGLIKAKSGLNVKKGVQATGVIDAGYTGPIVVKLYTLEREDIQIRPEMKIAQLLIVPVETPGLDLVSMEELEEDAAKASARKEGGFGSTGK